MIKDRVISALIGSMFIAVFQPFGLPYFGMLRWALLAGLTLISIISCVGSEYILRYIFRMPYDETARPALIIRRGLLFQLCNVTIMPLLMALFLDRFANNEQVNNHLSWQTYLWALAVCLCASFVIGLYWRNVYWRRFYHKQLQEAEMLSGMLMERARQSQSSSIETEKPDQTILLEGSTKESLSLLLSSLLYAESSGNYVTIHYLDGDVCKQTVLRMSMKSAATALCIQQNVMQCHRAFIVNLDHVEKVEGRSSGIGLQVSHCRESIPVSKGYAVEVKERIKNPVRS